MQPSVGAAEDDAARPEGDVIANKYTVVSVLGRGANGITYKVNHPFCSEFLADFTERPVRRGWVRLRARGVVAGRLRRGLTIAAIERTVPVVDRC